MYFMNSVQLIFYSYINLKVGSGNSFEFELSVPRAAVYPFVYNAVFHWARVHRDHHWEIRP